MGDYSRRFTPRGEPRVLLEQTVALRIPGSKTTQEELSAEVSASGLFIKSKRPSPVGTVLELDFSLGDESSRIASQGEIVAVRERDEGPARPAGMEVRFTELYGNGRDVLDRWLNHYLQTGNVLLELGEQGTNLQTGVAAVRDVLRQLDGAEPYRPPIEVELERAQADLAQLKEKATRAEDELRQGLETTQSALATAEEMVADLEQRVAEAAEERRAADQKIEGTEADRARLAEDLTGVRAEVSTLGRQLDEALSEGARQAGRIEALETSLAQAKTSRDDLTGRLKETTSHRDRLEKERAELDRVRLDLGAELEQSRSGFAEAQESAEKKEVELQRRLGALQFALDTADKEGKELGRRLAETTKLRETADQKIEQFEAEQLRLETELVGAHGETSSLEEALGKARETGRRQTDRVESLETSLDTAETSRRDLAERLEQVDTGLAVSEARATELARELAEAGTARDAASKMFEEADVERRRLVSQLADLRAEVSSLGEALTAARENGDQQAERVYALDASLAEAAASRDDLAVHLKKVDDGLVASNTRAEGLAQELSEAAEAREAADGRLEDADTERRRLISDLTGVCEEASSLEAALVATRESEVEQAERLEQLEASLTGAVASRDDLEVRLEDTTSERNGLKEKRAALELVRSDLKTELEQARVEMSRAQQQAVEKEASLERRIGAMQAAFDAAQKEGEERSRQLAETTDAHLQAKSDMDRIEESLVEVQTSRDQLSERLRDSASEREGLKQEKTLLETRRSELENGLKASREEIDGLQNEARETEAQLLRRLESSELLLEGAETRGSELSEELAEATTAREANDKRAQEAEAELRRLASDLAGVRTKESTLEEALGLARETGGQLAERVQTLESLVAKAETSRDEGTVHLEEVVASRDALREERAALTLVRKDLKAELEQSRAELSRTQQEASEKQRVLERRLGASESALASAESKSEEATATGDRLTHERDSLEVQRDDLQAELDLSRTRIGNLVREAQESQTENTHRLDSSESALAEANERLGELARELREGLEARVAVDSRLKDEEADHRELTAQLEGARSEAAALEEVLTELRAKGGRQTERIETLEASLTATESSVEAESKRGRELARALEDASAGHEATRDKLSVRLNETVAARDARALELEKARREISRLKNEAKTARTALGSAEKRGEETAQKLAKEAKTRAAAERTLEKQRQASVEQQRLLAERDRTGSARPRKVKSQRQQGARPPFAKRKIVRATAYGSSGILIGLLILLWATNGALPLLGRSAQEPIEAISAPGAPTALPTDRTESANRPDAGDEAFEAPVAPELVAEVAESEPSRSEVVEMLTAWTRSWSEQRVDDYLELYSTDFEPPTGLTRERWASTRRQRLQRPKRIQVSFDDLEIRDLGAGRVLTTFVQSYASDTFSDMARKTLELVRENGGWRIARESVEAIRPEAN